MEIAREVPCVWTPPPMTDPTSQIRLLWIHAGKWEEEVRCTVSVWNLEDAPKFRAISYTWGSPHPKAFITIQNVPSRPRRKAARHLYGIRVRVRENARYALWQARLYYPDSYLWIDSVCINQTDLQEKTAQVNRMAEIYADADMVLACIGPGDDSSDVIHELCHHADKWFEGHGDHNPGSLADTSIEEPEQSSGSDDDLDVDFFSDVDSYSDVLADVVLVCGHEMTNVVIEHWTKFFSREYWSRLWIIQELHGGGDQVQILCGTFFLDWKDLLDLQSKLGRLGFNKLWGDTAGSNLANLNYVLRFDGPILLAGNLDIFWPGLTHFSCEDVRDRVYGILGLFPWDRTDIPRPSPDYGISPFDLAVRLLPKFGIFDIARGSGIISALRLDESIKGDFIERFRASKSAEQRADPGFATCTMDVHSVHLIQQDCEGRFCIAIDRTGSEIGGAEEVGNSEICATYSNGADHMKLPQTRGQTPVQILTDGQVSAVAWPAVEHGDILIRVRRRLIVIRQTMPPTGYEVIGYAIGENALLDSGKRWSSSCKCPPDIRKEPWGQILKVSIAGLTRADVLMLSALRDTDSSMFPTAEYELLNVPAIGLHVEDVSMNYWQHRHEDPYTQHEAEVCNRYLRNPILFAAESTAERVFTTPVAQ